MTKKIFIITCCLSMVFPVYANNISEPSAVSIEKQENKTNDISKSITHESEDNLFEKIDVDCVFPIGKDCRAAFYLRDCNLRFQASPLDWMLVRNFSKVIHLFETKFEDFLENVEEIPNQYCGNCKYVNDVANDILSMHHFEKDVPFEQEHLRVRNLMQKYADEMDKILKKSNSICLICRRNDVSDDELIQFLKDFGAIYENKQLYLIHTVQNKDFDKVKKDTIVVNDKSKIIRYTFNDETPVNNPKNKPKWYGNYYVWEKIVNSINLNKDKEISDDSKVAKSEITKSI